LAKDLPALADATDDDFVREVAKRSHENYLYPVDGQVFSPAGELLDHVCANDHPSNDRYMQLLESALSD
jgi:hypothetical protein